MVTFPPAPRDDRTVTGLFEAQAARSPERRALVSRDLILSYAELDARATRLARELDARGLASGARVGVCLDRTPELLVAVLAVLKAGCAYVPLDPAYPPERLAHMASAAELGALLTSPACAGRVPETGRVVFEELEAAASAHSAEPLAPRATSASLLYGIFTSGSTGQPKCAGVFHRGFVNLLDWFTRDFAITAADRTLLVSSFSFDLTQKNLFAPLLTGGELHFPPPGPFDPTVLARAIAESGITLLNCTPSAFYPLVESAAGTLRGHLASLRCVFLGGEPINARRLAPWLLANNFRCTIVNTYGPTECTDICAFHRLTREDFLENAAPAPIGRAIPGAELRVLDEALAPCAAGASGELCVAGVGVGAGYLNDAALTAQKFLPQLTGGRLYRTGDSVRQRADGALEYIGRIDHQVKIGGFRVEPGEIEEVLRKAPGVSEAVVVVETHGGAPALLAWIAPEPTTPDWPQILRAFAAGQLPPHMVPAKFAARAAFPHSPNGKIDRRALAAETTPAPAAGSLPAQDALTQIWREVLGLAAVGPDDNFFDLGGNSLRLIQCQSWLRSRLGIELPITELFQYPTLRALAARLHSATVSADRDAFITRADARHAGLARKKALARQRSR